MNIRAKDLNLLSIFLVVSEELNLSRASKRLNLSQPALSHAIARLRREFGDPLFVRGQRGLTPTAKVAELAPKVRELLDAAEKIYSPSKFDLSKVQRKVVIASTTYFESLAMGNFLRLAHEEAPGLKVETRALSAGFPKHELESGEYAVAIAAYFEALPQGFRLKGVRKDPFALVCAKKNPFLKSERALADYLAARHLQIEVPPGHVAQVDQLLRAKGKARDIALRIGNFLTPAAILEETDLLLTCPRSLAERYREMSSLEITELPLRLPVIETRMVWHERYQQDPFHAWLRSALTRAAN